MISEIKETHALIDKLRAMLPSLMDRRAVHNYGVERVGDYMIESESTPKSVDNRIQQ